MIVCTLNAEEACLCPYLRACAPSCHRMYLLMIYMSWLSVPAYDVYVIADSTRVPSEDVSFEILASGYVFTHNTPPSILRHAEDCPQWRAYAVGASRPLLARRPVRAAQKYAEEAIRHPPHPAGRHRILNYMSHHVACHVNTLRVAC